MRTGPFKTLLVALATFAAFNGVVHRLSRNSVPRQVLARIESSPAPDVVAIGNSLMAAGFDANEFAADLRSRGVDTCALNLGLGGSGTVEHLLLVRRALERHPHLKLVVYGFSDRQLTSGFDRRWWRLFGNYALSFHTEPDVAARYYAPSGRLETTAFCMLARVPVFVERGSMWARVERLRRALGSLGLPEVAEGRFGRVEDFDELDRTDELAFRTACRMAVESGPLLDGPTSDLLATASARGVPVALVSMPRRSPHRRRFFQTEEWRGYLDALHHRAHELGARFVDAGEWVSDDGLFEDGLHLGPSGARVFSRRLGEELASQLR